MKQPDNHFSINSCVRWEPILELISCGLLLFGVKLWLIHSYGNATPFWDQWDAEAANLYKPYFDGTLAFSHWFAPHNEHRIFMTRLLALTLLLINGIWNPLLQMIVNAALHVMVLLFFVILLARVIGRATLPSLLIFCTLLFAIPYAWENTLAGFQSQFYFAALFSIACMWLTSHRCLSLAWWCGIGAGICAFFSLASGIFALAATACAGMIMYGLNVRRDKMQLIAIVVASSLVVVGIVFTPNIPGHAPLKAKSFSQLCEGLIAILSWPLPGNWANLLLRNGPVLILGVWVLRHRPPTTDKIWLFVSLAFWMGMQASSIAYGRADRVLSPRYLDLVALGVLVNFACLLWLVGNYSREHSRIVALIVSIWTIAIVSALGTHVMRDALKTLPDKKFIGMAQETNTRAFLLTGDFAHLKDKPHGTIPYPNAERLASILSEAKIRQILPSNIAHPLPGGLDSSGRLDAMTNRLLERYLAVIAFGLILFLLIAAFTRHRNVM